MMWSAYAAALLGFASLSCALRVWLPRTGCRLPSLRSHHSSRDSHPVVNPIASVQSSTSKSIARVLQATAGALIVTSRNSQRANAIGTLAEFKDQPIIFQDIAFNTMDTFVLEDFFTATFPSSVSILSSTSVKGVNTTVVSFGPNAYKSPKSFYPGVSPFSADGGHATLTFRSEELPDTTIALVERGNGLQFIKIGSETFRISKAIEKGAEVKYAYGWVSLDTPIAPNGIPLQLIVGTTRDPLMFAAIRVGDLQASLDFFTQRLGMRPLPFPTARSAGSNFEPPQAKDSVYVGYTADSLGILLLPSVKGDAPLVVGADLAAFTFVVDDKAQPEGLPPAAREFLQGGSSIVLSPDGYPIQLRKYSDFERSAVTVTSVA